MDKVAIKEAIELFVLDFGYVPLDVRVDLNHGAFGVHFSIFKKKNITIMDCSRVTLAVKDFLISFLGTDDFSVDVSSPGAERVLKKPFEYGLFEGKKARVIMVDGTEIIGTLKGFKEECSRVVFLDRDLVEHEIPVNDVGRCQLILE